MTDSRLARWRAEIALLSVGGLQRIARHSSYSGSPALHSPTRDHRGGWLGGAGPGLRHRQQKGTVEGALVAALSRTTRQTFRHTLPRLRSQLELLANAVRAQPQLKCRDVVLLGQRPVDNPRQVVDGALFVDQVTRNRPAEPVACRAGLDRRGGEESGDEPAGSLPSDFGRHTPREYGTHHVVDQPVADELQERGDRQRWTQPAQTGQPRKLQGLLARGGPSSLRDDVLPGRDRGLMPTEHGLLDLEDHLLGVPQQSQRRAGPVVQVVWGQRDDCSEPVRKRQLTLVRPRPLRRGLIGRRGELLPTPRLLKEALEALKNAVGAQARRLRHLDIPFDKDSPPPAQRGNVTQRGRRGGVSGEISTEPVQRQLVSAGDGGRDGNVGVAVPPDDPADRRVLTQPVGDPSDGHLTGPEDASKRWGSPATAELVSNHGTQLSLGQSCQQWQAQVQATDSRAQTQPGPVPGGSDIGVRGQEHLVRRSDTRTLGYAVDLNPEQGLHVPGDGHAHQRTSLLASASHQQHNPEGGEQSEDDNARSDLPDTASLGGDNKGRRNRQDARQRERSESSQHQQRSHRTKGVLHQSPSSGKDTLQSVAIGHRSDPFGPEMSFWPSRNVLLARRSLGVSADSPQNGPKDQPIRPSSGLGTS